MNNYNEFNPQNNNYPNINNSVNNFGPVSGDNFNNVVPKKSNNYKKGCIIIFLVILFLTIAGGVAIAYFNSDGFKENRNYKEYTQLQNINDYLGIDALSTTTEFFDDDELYHDTTRKHVVLEVTNNSDYYINNLMVDYFSSGFISHKRISLRPHSRAVIDNFIIDEKDEDKYRNIELKKSNSEDEEKEAYLSKEAKENIIYADDIKLDFKKSDDNDDILFKLTNNSKYDFEFNTSDVNVYIYNYLISRNGIPANGLRLKEVGSKDEGFKFNIPKESSRDFVFEPSSDNFLYKTSGSYKIVFVFSGKDIKEE